MPYYNTDQAHIPQHTEDFYFSKYTLIYPWQSVVILSVKQSLSVILSYCRSYGHTISHMVILLVILLDIRSYCWTYGHTVGQTLKRSDSRVGPMVTYNYIFYWVSSSKAARQLIVFVLFFLLLLLSFSGSLWQPIERLGEKFWYTGSG